MYVCVCTHVCVMHACLCVCMCVLCLCCPQYLQFPELSNPVTCFTTNIKGVMRDLIHVAKGKPPIAKYKNFYVPKI